MLSLRVSSDIEADIFKSGVYVSADNRTRLYWVTLSLPRVRHCSCLSLVLWRGL